MDSRSDSGFLNILIQIGEALQRQRGGDVTGWRIP